jgi:hypothetical protein
VCFPLYSIYITGESRTKRNIEVCGEEETIANKKVKLDMEPKEAPSPDPQPDDIPEPSSVADVSQFEEKTESSSPKLRIKSLVEMEENSLLDVSVLSESLSTDKEGTAKRLRTLSKEVNIRKYVEPVCSFL